MDHFELDVTDNLVADLAPVSPAGVNRNRISTPPGHEWWYIFGLQFLLWWCLWAIVDSAPELLGYKSLSPVTELKIYLGDSALGAIIYMIPVPLVLSEQSMKLKRFIGLVVMCCGAWGALDSSTELLESILKIPSLFTYLAVLAVAAILGAIHHYNYREGYLIDHLA